MSCSAALDPIGSCRSLYSCYEQLNAALENLKGSLKMPLRHLYEGVYTPSMRGLLLFIIPAVETFKVSLCSLQLL